MIFKIGRQTLQLFATGFIPPSKKYSMWYQPSPRRTKTITNYMLFSNCHLQTVAAAHQRWIGGTHTHHLQEWLKYAQNQMVQTIITWHNTIPNIQWQLLFVWMRFYTACCTSNFVCHKFLPSPPKHPLRRIKSIPQRSVKHILIDITHQNNL